MNTIYALTGISAIGMALLFFHRSRIDWMIQSLFTTSGIGATALILMAETQSQLSKAEEMAAAALATIVFILLTSALLKLDCYKKPILTLAGIMASIAAFIIIFGKENAKAGTDAPAPVDMFLMILTLLCIFYSTPKATPQLTYLLKSWIGKLRHKCAR